MKRNKLSIFLTILSFTLVSSGVFIGMVDNFKLDKRNTIEIENKINDSYNQITSKMDSLHTSMIEMQDFFALYYENIDSNKNEYDNKLNNIKLLKNDINSEVMDLNDLCSITINNNTKRKCESIYSKNKIINNNYKELEENYDKFLKKHNEWLLAYAN